MLLALPRVDLDRRLRTAVSRVDIEAKLTRRHA